MSLREHSPLITVRVADGERVRTQRTMGHAVVSDNGRDQIGYELAVLGNKKTAQWITLTYNELRLMVDECERLADRLRAEHAEARG